MKKLLLLLILTLGILPVFAAHITGGEIYYDYTGPGLSANSKRYRITLRLFRDENCMSCANMPASVVIGIYNNDNNNLLNGFITIPITRTEILPINALPVCITNPPALEYSAGYYITSIDIPNNEAGFTVSYQTCCRINNIENTSDQVGATYSSNIPGNLVLGALTSSSPRFNTGISVVCYNQPFTLDFSATDPDGDSLVYSLCNAFSGGGATSGSNNPSNYTTPAPPPFPSIPYTNAFSGLSPLGSQATINSQTGIISGIAPQSGKYVVSVCIRSYRNGQYIGDHKKDFIVTVAPCDFSKAQLDLNYINCKDFTFNFKNNNNSPLNLTFFWDFGDGQVSNQEFPTHTYAAAGTYNLKLVINRGGSCSDSMSVPVNVYPVFTPAFTENSPMCKNIPVQFNDASTANFGIVNNWKWDFGVPTVTNDTSRIKNPSFAYNTAGTYMATLIVGSDRGCTDTFSRDIIIVDKPNFKISNDTLICVVDTLRLQTSTTGNGTITWSPNYMINNVNSLTPLVSPDVTTTYYSNFADNFGCTAVDSVTINVVTDATLSVPADTSICLTDSVLLAINSNAIYYQWTPTASLSNSTIKNPFATPTAASTTYNIRASISNKCFKTATITIGTSPYPIANAGADTTICQFTPAVLQASGGSIYNWTPATFLSNPSAANTTVAGLPFSFFYVVEVRDILGCPKPAFDTVVINVVQIVANAGPSDTSVVIGQPLQLNATGSTNYQWTPNQWLSDANIASPVSLPQNDIQYIVRVSNNIGCEAFDSINVKLFKVKPDLYVPSAFTPGKDGLNDIFRPIALGIKSLESFTVYNRWGQKVYATSTIGKGWDGKIGGKEQGSGTFVWYAEATDYLNNKISRKGTVILIR